MKILINTPDIKLSGGVASHYRGLQKFWSLNVNYNIIGSRNKKQGLVLIFYDFVAFFIKCLFGNYSLIILNPSLGKTAIVRDAIFLKIARITKKKTIVFWHGWSKELVTKFNTDSSWFKQKYQYADMHLVLSSEFKKDLINWGIKSPIKLTTTKVDDQLIMDCGIQQNDKLEFTILFLTRIEIYKGIFIVLEAFKELLKSTTRVKLVIAGEGSQLKAAKEFTQKYKLENVKFLGNVSGEQLVQTFMSADIYILPTFSEGMPTSVLEAMAFGLPIITRPVGGLNDFFEECKMGFLIESFEPKDYSEKISYLINNRDILNKISNYNQSYAKKHFLGSKVAENLEKIFLSI